MAQTREIKGRIKAVGNIQRITKTMQMIATAKFQSAQRRASATKPYTEKISELVDQLAAAQAGDDEAEFSHPLMQSPDPATGREILLVLTSNRGLCGGYNGNVLRKAGKLLREHTDTTWEIDVVGKKGLNYFRFIGYEIHDALSHFDDDPSYEDVERLASRYIQRFEAGEVDAVRVCYMEFVSNSRQEPRIVQLLPIENVGSEAEADAPEAGSAHAEDYDFLPSPEQLLNELLPITVKTRLFQCFTDAVVSEQIARMVAMKAATDNAGEIKKNLKRKFNRARQAQITTELTEIISGAAALE